MGRGVGVYCEACGWERQFIFGRGILSSCKDECLESLKSGEFGNLAQRMADERLCAECWCRATPVSARL